MRRARPVSARRPVGSFGSIAFAAALAVIASAVPCLAGEPVLGLGDLESRVDQAPGVLALAREIDVAVAAESVSYARDGLQYFLNNGIGPRSDIVLHNVNNTTFRYSQSVGVQLPILGAAIAQKNAFSEALKVEKDALIEYQDDRRQVLAKLRAAYVAYWQDDRAEAIANAFAGRMRRDLPLARALRRTGFWTEENVLDYLQTLSRFETAARDDRSQKRAQLAIISAALGGDVAPFRPLDPAFAATCAPGEDDAVRSALAIDPGLAKIAADRAQVEAQLERVRGSSIDARVTADIGTVADFIAPQAGYDVTAGLVVALPSHARSEERSLRSQLEAELDEQTLRSAQRRADVAASVKEAVGDLSDARNDAHQAEVDEAAAREALREAEVRYRTIPGTGGAGFNDVQTRVAEEYAAQNASALARATVFERLYALLAIAPEACTAR